MALFQADESKI